MIHIFIMIYRYNGCKKKDIASCFQYISTFFAKSFICFFYASTWTIKLNKNNTIKIKKPFSPLSCDHLACSRTSRFKRWQLTCLKARTVIFMCRQGYIHVCTLRAIRARSLSLCKHVNGRQGRKREREREEGRRDVSWRGGGGLQKKKVEMTARPGGAGERLSRLLYTFALHFCVRANDTVQNRSRRLHMRA